MAFTFLIFCAGIVSCLAFDPPHEFDCGPLCDYNRIEDGHFKWEVITVYPDDGFTTYVLNVTSQKWYDYDFIDRPIWWHHFTIHVPDVLRYKNNAMIYVTSRNNNSSPPSASANRVWQTGVWCNRTGMITSVLRQVPNQPIIFVNTTRERSEDATIAYTWRLFLEEPLGQADPYVVLRMPMTKSVSKAMDALIEFIRDDPSHMQTGHDIQRFMIAGESKRGWTTWMMPPVDSRVEVIAPIVLSCLNMMELTMGYYQSLGGWPFATIDYWVEDIFSYMGQPKGYELMDLVDPYSERYRAALDIPKLMVSGASDEFFFIDDYDYFFDGLPGEKYVWLQENTGHSVTGGPLQEDYWRMLETFYVAYLEGKTYPKFSWQRQVTSMGASILLYTEEEVSLVSSWYSVTPDVVYPRRDFRNMALNPVIPIDTNITWYEKPVSDLGNGFYEVYHDNPPAGKYLAFFIKIHFPWEEEGREFIFTTQAQIIPEGYPYPKCSGPGVRGCRGILK